MWAHIYCLDTQLSPPLSVLKAFKEAFQLVFQFFLNDEGGVVAVHVHNQGGNAGLIHDDVLDGTDSKLRLSSMYIVYYSFWQLGQK